MIPLEVSSTHDSVAFSCETFAVSPLPDATADLFWKIFKFKVASFEVQVFDFETVIAYKKQEGRTLI
jgi:hypothetical protein